MFIITLITYWTIGWKITHLLGKDDTTIYGEVWLRNIFIIDKVICYRNTYLRLAIFFWAGVHNSKVICTCLLLSSFCICHPSRDWNCNACLFSVFVYFHEVRAGSCPQCCHLLPSVRWHKLCVWPTTALRRSFIFCSIPKLSGSTLPGETLN